MQLAWIGIIIECQCGGAIAAGIGDVLFDNRGEAMVRCRLLFCPSCKALHHEGERLRYRLGPMQWEKDDQTRQSQANGDSRAPLKSGRALKS